MDRPPSSALRTLATWCATGAACGAWVALATIRMNGSILGVRDALVFQAWVALVYALAFGLVGILAALVVRLTGTRPVTASDHVAIALTTMLGWVVGSYAATRTGAWVTETHLRSIAAGAGGAFVALLASALTRARGLFGDRPRVRLLPVVLLGLVAAPIVAATWAPRPAAPAPAPVDVAPEPSTPRRQVVLIGMDGADWEHLRPLALAGRLPHWRRLMEEGLVAPLASRVPTWSPILWTTIATGRRAADHGILDFTSLDVPGLEHGPQRLRVGFRLAQNPLPSGPPVPEHVGLAPLVDQLVERGILHETPMRATNRRVPALWNLLSRAGRSVAVLRWWATWPPEVVDGWLAADDQPRKTALARRKGDGGAGGVTHPPGWLDELAALEGPFWEAEGDPDPRAVLFRDLSDERYARLPDDLVERAWNGWRDDRFGIAAARELLAEQDVDFLAVYTCSIDILGHLLEPQLRDDPAYAVVLERAYEESDVLLGELLAERRPETTYVIVSDHGWTYSSERYGHYDGPSGLLLLAGDGVDVDAILDHEPSVDDVTPTILALFGLPATDEMPGRVVREALSDEVTVPARIPTYGPHRPRWSIDRDATARDGGAEELERLRALGYVE